jgi:ketosteroid isomerase-like protein
MGVAREVSKQSMALTEARDREGWLGLFADDAVVEDPVGPSMLDPEGKGRVGKAAITDFYDNVITTSEKIEFTIRDSVECGNEVANVGQIRITMPGGGVAIVPIVNIYKVNDAGQLVSLRSFWEAEKLSFTEG